MAAVERTWYDKVDEQAIHPKIRLQSGLNRYPAPWLDALYQTLRLPPIRLRKDRVAAAAQALLQPDTLRRVVTALPTQARAALLEVLEAGGWIKYGSLSRRFGGEDEDSYFWSEHPPASAIGQLRMRGLLFVGRMAIDGRNWKVAVVPLELRDLLKSEL